MQMHLGLDLIEFQVAVNDFESVGGCASSAQSLSLPPEVVSIKTPAVRVDQSLNLELSLVSELTWSVASCYQHICVSVDEPRHALQIFGTSKARINVLFREGR